MGASDGLNIEGKGKKTDRSRPSRPLNYFLEQRQLFSFFFVSFYFGFISSFFSFLSLTVRAWMCATLCVANGGDNAHDERHFRGNQPHQQEEQPLSKSSRVASSRVSTRGGKVEWSRVESKSA